jgi:hypothetical protein
VLQMVNVFIPYNDVEKSIKSLHIRTISKMLHEINIILKAIHGDTKGYKNHPITLMWAKKPNILVFYQSMLLDEYIKRTYPHLINPLDPLMSGHFKIFEDAVNEHIKQFDEEYFRLQRQHLRHKGEQYKTDWYIKQYPMDITKQ